MAGRLPPSMIPFIRIRDGWHDSTSYIPRSLIAHCLGLGQAERSAARKRRVRFRKPEPFSLPTTSGTNRIMRHRAYLAELAGSTLPSLLSCSVDVKHPDLGLGMVTSDIRSRCHKRSRVPERRSTRSPSRRDRRSIPASAFFDFWDARRVDLDLDL